MTTELLTAEELAERLRLKASTVHGWARIGKIPKVRLSRKVIRFDPAEVIETLARRRTIARGAENV